MGHEVSTLSVDARLEVLAHPERRRLVEELLAAAPDAELPVVAGSDADADRLRIAMHHVHVPKLVEQGVVERGVTPQHVRRGPAFDDIVTLLRAATDRADLTVGRCA
jgi:hypothetical protein